MIEQGEFFSLLGPSGCGKTTTLRMLAGFEVPTEGRILLEGEPVENVPPYKRDVNMVFQSYALFDHLDVADNVAFGLKRRRVAKDEIARRVGEALELVNLAERAGARTNELSGGQRQRVALARALVNRPKVLLLDEPLGALDLKLRRQMQVELKAIQREVGITFVYVTHDQEEALVDVGPDRGHERRPRRPVRSARGHLRASQRASSSPASSASRTCSRARSRTDGQVRIANGLRVAVALPDGVSAATSSTSRCARRRSRSTRRSRRAWSASRATIEARVYLGVMTQITVSLGDGARLVALEQATYRARARTIAGSPG